jgi:hypothetical protein
MKEGYTNVHALLGGLYGYKDGGGEVIQGTPPPPAPVPMPEAKAPEAKSGAAAGAVKPVVKRKH